MKPPICELCGDRFDPGDGALVEFASDDATRAFDERQEHEPGFVGHRPNLGWFCGEHAAAARDLTRSTRRVAMAMLRSPSAD